MREKKSRKTKASVRDVLQRPSLLQYSSAANLEHKILYKKKKEVITFMPITMVFCLVILGLTSLQYYCFLRLSGLREAVLREKTLCSVVDMLVSSATGRFDVSATYDSR